MPVKLNCNKGPDTPKTLLSVSLVDPSKTPSALKAVAKIWPEPNGNQSPCIAKALVTALFDGLATSKNDIVIGYQIIDPLFISDHNNQNYTDDKIEQYIFK